KERRAGWGRIVRTDVAWDCALGSAAAAAAGAFGRRCVVCHCRVLNGEVGVSAGFDSTPVRRAVAADRAIANERGLAIEVDAAPSELARHNVRAVVRYGAVNHCQTATGPEETTAATR